ncbi:MAG TPA: SDR family oxidoreductase [Saprospiraceae bacterium]|nr:SDR family oxidoreductase [Saprospiraceae bacterium]
MDINLKGKNALVCGGSGGIGKASAIVLSQLGANVTLLARNAETLGDALKELDHTKGQHHDFIVADTSDEADFHRKLVGLSIQRTIHILVNNSGGPPAGNIADAETAAFKNAFAQHLLANHVAAQLLLPGMKKERYGRIINIISTSVKQPLRGLGVSNTIRAAVANWSKTLATELAPFGITVNNVLPGATETDRLISIVSNKANKTGRDIDDVRKEMLAEIPMGRFGTAEEIANAVGFLASPAAAYITGTQITVDGGRTGVL